MLSSLIHSSISRVSTIAASGAAGNNLCHTPSSVLSRQGAANRWRVERLRLSWPVLDLFQQAAAEFGIPATEDFNRGDNEGTGYFEVNQRRGVRWSAARGFLKPALMAVDYEVVQAGTVAGQRFSWVGWLNGKDILAIHEEWVVTRDLPQWGLRPLAKGEKAPLIRAVVTGLPGFELQLDVGWDPGVPAELVGTSPGHLMIGMSAVRAIPYVLASPPGIVKAPVLGAFRMG